LCATWETEIKLDHSSRPTGQKQFVKLQLNGKKLDHGEKYKIRRNMIQAGLDIK
jgi:hypothetical protein